MTIHLTASNRKPRDHLAIARRNRALMATSYAGPRRRDFAPKHIRALRVVCMLGASVWKTL